MELKKKKYKRAEVLAILDEYKKEYESRILELKANIQEILKEKTLIQQELESIKEREGLIIATLERAEKTARDLIEKAELEYSIEINRLKTFSEKWEGYFKKVKEKYPTSTTVKKAVNTKNKIDNAVKKGGKSKNVIDEINAIIDGDAKRKFAPKEKIRDYIAATGDNGFNLDEVLNPGKLQLEDLCKELGLIEEND